MAMAMGMASSRSPRSKKRVGQDDGRGGGLRPGKLRELDESVCNGKRSPSLGFVREPRPTPAGPVRSRTNYIKMNEKRSKGRRRGEGGKKKKKKRAVCDARRERDFLFCTRARWLRFSDWSGDSVDSRGAQKRKQQWPCSCWRKPPASRRSLIWRTRNTIPSNLLIRPAGI
jgi:hypothetical protein